MSEKEVSPVYGGIITTIDLPRHWNDTVGWDRVQTSVSAVLRHAVKAYHTLGLDPEVFVPEAELGPAMDYASRPRPLGWHTQTSICGSSLNVGNTNWGCVVKGKHTVHRHGDYRWRA